MSNTTLTSRIANDLKAAPAIVSDIDKTLIGSRVAQSAFSLIKYEQRNKNYHKVAFGVLSGLTVYFGTEIQKRLRGPLPSENWGLGLHHKSMSIVGVDKELLQGFTSDYVKKHELPGARSLLTTLREFGARKDLFLATTASSIYAEVASEFFGAIDFVANPTEYDAQNKVKGVSILLRTESDKVERTKQMLAKHGIGLRNSVFFGDSKTDLGFLNEVSLFVASPKADEAVRARAHIQISDYREFESQLRQL